MTLAASQNMQELQNARQQCLGSMFGADRGSIAAPNNTTANDPVRRRLLVMGKGLVEANS
jgi:hypothetical protein